MNDGRETLAPTVTAPEPVAFLDLGTNSMRLLVVRVEPDGSYAVLTQQKETVRLGDGAFATDELQPAAIERTVLVGKRFAEMARSFGAREIHAVATSATRDASNRRVLLDRLRDEGGLDVRVISGREEARLIYLGVASAARWAGETALFIDVGGGSTELIVGTDSEHLYLDTLRLGAIRLANLFFLPDDPNPIGDGRWELVSRYVRAHVVRSVQRLREFDLGLAIGSSGTIQTLGDIVAHRTLGRPLEKHDTFTRKQLREGLRTLAGLPVEERLRVPGMSASRVDLIVPGGIVFDVLLEELGIDRIAISDRTLRDGLLMEHVARCDPHGEMEHLSFRAQSVLRLARKCRVDLDHARHVAKLALEMFDTAREAGLHGFGPLERELLEYAGILHDVGAFLTYTNHRQHSYYFIRNAELLGLDETEVGIIATTALFHKKTYPRKRHPEFAALDRDAQQVVRVLCVLLRVAESLDRSHATVIRSARIVAEEARSATLALDTGGDCELELWSVGAHAKAFRRSFDRKLRVEADGRPADIDPAAVPDSEDPEPDA